MANQAIRLIIKWNIIGNMIDFDLKYNNAAIIPFINKGMVVVKSINPCIIVDIYELIMQPPTTFINLSTFSSFFL